LRNVSTGVDEVSVSAWTALLSAVPGEKPPRVLRKLLRPINGIEKSLAFEKGLEHVFTPPLDLQEDAIVVAGRGTAETTGGVASARKEFLPTAKDDVLLIEP